MPATNPIKQLNAFSQVPPPPVINHPGIQISMAGKIRYLTSCKTTTKIDLKALLNFKSHICKRCKYYSTNQNEITSENCLSFKAKGLCEGCKYSPFVTSPRHLISDFQTANDVEFSKKAEIIKQYDETKKLEIQLPMPEGNLAQVKTEAKFPDYIETFMEQFQNVLSMPHDYVESLFIAFSSIFMNNFNLKIKNDWVLSPSINLVLTGFIEQKRDLCFKFFLNLLNKIESEEQKKYKKAKIYTDDFNFAGINSYYDDNPHGVSIVSDDDFILNPNEEVQETLYNKIKRIQKQSVIKSILLNINKDELKKLINSECKIKDFMIVNPDNEIEGGLSEDEIDEKLKERIEKLFCQLYSSKEQVYKFNDKSFEYFNKKVSIEMFSMAKKYNNPVIQDLFYTSVDNIAKISLIIQAIKQKSGGHPDNEISLSTIELAHKITTKYLMQTLKFMDIEVPENQKMVIVKELPPKFEYKNVVNFDNESFSLKNFDDFPLELDKLLSWLGFRKNIKNIANWNILKPREVAKANVSGIRHSEKARILLDKAKEHGLGLWNYDKTKFCVFEDIIAN